MTRTELVTLDDITHAVHGSIYPMTRCGIPVPALGYNLPRRAQPSGDVNCLACLDVVMSVAPRPALREYSDQPFPLARPSQLDALMSALRDYYGDGTLMISRDSRRDSYDVSRRCGACGRRRRAAISERSLEDSRDTIDMFRRAVDSLYQSPCSCKGAIHP